jgi:hypothetical protein
MEAEESSPRWPATSVPCAVCEDDFLRRTNKVFREEVITQFGWRKATGLLP